MHALPGACDRRCISDRACPPMTRTVPCRSFCKLSGRTATYHRFMATLKHRSALHVVPHTAPRIDIGISEPNRRKIATGLGRLLADTYTLYLKTHNFHWNVTGPMFQTLHVMFEEQVHRAVAGGRSDRRANSRARLPCPRDVQGVSGDDIDQRAGRHTQRRRDDSRAGRRAGGGGPDRAIDSAGRRRRSMISLRSTS